MRSFIVGDVHGCLDELDELDELLTELSLDCELLLLSPDELDEDS